MAMDPNALDWNDEIEDDGAEMSVFPEGDYNFQVIKFERGQYPGSAKITSCNKAVLTLRVDVSPTEQATIITDLMLHKVMEWKISSFFRCIGMKKHGERLQMNWSKVPGARGRAHFKVRTWGTDNQNKRSDVDKYLDFDPKYFTQQRQQPAPGGWEDADGYDTF